ncbi:MAG: hypothetical protein HQM16_13155 [Deltaproteobacteria bacterium]|nr:hypothetical protein [Deltaproteobacteria bacterium]
MSNAVRPRDDLLDAIRITGIATSFTLLAMTWSAAKLSLLAMTASSSRAQRGDLSERFNLT